MHLISYQVHFSIKKNSPFPNCSDFLQLVCYVWQQSNDPCAFDSCSQLSLMFSACSRYSLRKDLTSFSNILLKFLYVFVIDGFSLVSTELANLFSSHTATVMTSIVIHHYNYLLSLEWNVFVDCLE